MRSRDFNSNSSGVQGLSMDITVFSNRNGSTFSRSGARGRIFVAGNNRLTDGQVRNVANILLVPKDEPIRLVDPDGQEIRHVFS